MAAIILTNVLYLQNTDHKLNKPSSIIQDNYEKLLDDQQKKVINWKLN